MAATPSALAWLLVALSPWGDIEVTGPHRAARCEASVRAYAEHNPRDTSQCVNAAEPWRRITKAGPNEYEVKARRTDVQEQRNAR